MAQKRKPWTADDDAELRRLAESGSARGDIASKLGRSIGSIEVRASLRDIKIRSTYKKPTKASAQASVQAEARPKLRKFFEALSNGKRTGQIAYVMTLARLPTPSGGIEWTEDKNFNAANEVLAHPALKAIFKAALEQGCALTTEK